VALPTGIFINHTGMMQLGESIPKSFIITLIEIKSKMPEKSSMI